MTNSVAKKYFNLKQLLIVKNGFWPIYKFWEIKLSGAPVCDQLGLVEKLLGQPRVHQLVAPHSVKLRVINLGKNVKG